MARSPLRWPASSSARQKGRSVTTAACGRLRHLQAVATWASAQVPTLGAFLGSRLASASQSLGCPPPSSPHVTCQRCESILQVGINCSVCIRSRKRKKQSQVSKKASTPINNILYYCNYCAFENMKLGTPKAYVKAKLREVAARHKLSDLNKGETTTKASNNALVSASSSKRQKRKGWLSLKQLTVSSADVSPSASCRPVLMKTAVLTPILRVKILESPKVVPKVSQVDVESTSPLSIKEQCPLGLTKDNLELEPCITPLADARVKSISNLIASHIESLVLGDSATSITDMCLSSPTAQHQTGVAASTSPCDAECPRCNDNNGAVLERQLTNAAGSSLALRHIETSAVPLELERKEQLTCQESETEPTIMERLVSSASVSKHDKSKSAAVSQTDINIVAPSSLVQGELICKDANLSPSSVNTLLYPDSPTRPLNGLHLNPLQLPLKEDEGVLMSDIVGESEDLIKRKKKGKRGPLGVKKRELEEHEKWHKIAKKQKLVMRSDMQYDSNLALGKEADSKKWPVFRRIGRHWFTKCRSRTSNWRII